MKKHEQYQADLKLWQKERNQFAIERAKMVEDLIGDLNSNLNERKRIELLSIVQSAPEHMVKKFIEKYTSGEEVKRLGEWVENYLLDEYVPHYASFEAYMENKHGLIRDGQSFTRKQALLTV